MKEYGEDYVIITSLLNNDSAIRWTWIGVCEIFQ